VAKRLHQAFTQTEESILHLCPMDCFGQGLGEEESASSIATWGDNEVRRLDRAELDQLVCDTRVVRHNSSWVFPSGELQQITWLIVREKQKGDFSA
jgi:hypothetical protein